MKQRKFGTSCVRIVLFSAIGLVGLCLVLAAVSAMVNRGLPQHSQSIDRLRAEDIARLAEVEHLRRVLGGQVLPGWDQADIPLILYNEQYAFLVGLRDPADGWLTIPGGRLVGGPWERVEGAEALGQPYYRQRLPDGVSPQNFTVLVGDRNAASLMTLEWFRISMANQFRADLPEVARPVFPYALVANLFMPGSDRWSTTVLHEAAHAYQGIRAGERLASAERAGFTLDVDYPWEDERFRQEWQAELDLLNKALRASSEAETRALAAQFLEQRSTRRTTSGLSAGLVSYESAREWSEGIAKYAEFSIYRLAAAPAYQPVPQIIQDNEFHGYRDYDRHWNNEVSQVRRMAGDRGDGRFYYSGMAQAMMLDRLSPGWKDQLFEEDVWLEDLLAQALEE